MFRENKDCLTFNVAYQQAYIVGLNVTNIDVVRKALDERRKRPNRDWSLVRYETTKHANS